MLESIPYRLFNEWQLYYQSEPFGQERDNLHAGIVAASIYDVNVKENQRGRVKARDFLLVAEEKIEKTPQEIYSTMRLIAIGFGAKEPGSNDHQEPAGQIRH